MAEDDRGGVGAADCLKVSSGWEPTHPNYETLSFSLAAGCPLINHPFDRLADFLIFKLKEFTTHVDAIVFKKFVNLMFDEKGGLSHAKTARR